MRPAEAVVKNNFFITIIKRLQDAAQGRIFGFSKEEKLLYPVARRGGGAGG